MLMDVTRLRYLKVLAVICLRKIIAQQYRYKILKKHYSSLAVYLTGIFTMPADGPMYTKYSQHWLRFSSRGEYQSTHKGLGVDVGRL